jgi:membrane-associated phospholipid phosphatase
MTKQSKKNNLWNFGTVEGCHHHWLMLIWILYFIVFIVEEHFITTGYWVSYLPLDDKIPFCEYFIIPYCTWYPLLLCMTLYLCFFDKPGFIRFMSFIGVGFLSVCVLYAIFPNGQDLRPAVFERHNFFTWLIGRIYAADTNTNVCPSLHVVGCSALICASFDSPELRKRHIPWIMLPLGILVSISTVFIKQHSVLDLITAVPYSAVVWLVVYHVMFPNKKMRPERVRPKTKS